MKSFQLINHEGVPQYELNFTQRLTNVLTCHFKATMQVLMSVIKYK